MEEQKQTTTQTEQPAALTADQKSQLFDSLISRFAINSDPATISNVDSIYGSIQKQFVDRLIADETFKKPIYDSGYGQAMGKITTIIRQKFGVEVKDRPIEEILTEVASRQGVDSQELTKAKQVAELAEARLKEYEEKVLPAKLSEVESMRRDYEIEMQLKRELSDISILGVPSVAINQLKMIMPSQYNIDLSNGKLRLTNKNGTPVTKPNSMVEYSTKEIIVSILDDLQLLNNNNTTNNTQGKGYSTDSKKETTTTTQANKIGNKRFQAALDNLNKITSK